MGIKLSEIDNAKLRAKIQAQLQADNKLMAGRIRASQSESDQRNQGQDRGVETSQDRIRYCVVFTTYRKRLLDEGDNSNSALKAIRDRIAFWLGCPNDSREYFEFEYHQVKSSTVQGTHILVHRL